MHSTTKTKLFLVAFMLLSLGWAQLGWSANIAQSLRELTYKFPDKLQQEYESARTSPYSVFVQENIAVIGGVYALIALFLLRNSDYRDSGWRNFRVGCITLLALVGWFVVGHWIAVACQEISQAHGGHDLISIVTGIIWPLLTIALILTLWVGVLLYLLFLLFTFPSILFVIVPFLVRLPVLTYHYPHYLSVPHPAETAYRAGIANDLPMEELASVVADAMYMYDQGDLDVLPPAWKSRNQKKRADAFKDLVSAEGPLMEAIMANLEMKDKLREHRRTTHV
jgi:hypothetical protein